MQFNFNVNLSASAAGEASPTLSSEDLYDILIVGGGPAGLNAALYAKRKGAKVGLIATTLGGQVTDTSQVDNYLGLPNLSGTDLVQKFIAHVKELSVPLVTEGWVESIGISSNRKERLVYLQGGEVYRAKVLILATGSKPRLLNVPGETEYAGRGVAYCAICDGPMYRGKTVVVAGGGNSAVEAAIDLAKLASHVTLVHRSKLRADQILVDQLTTCRNVTIRLETQIQEILGDDLVNGIRILDKNTGLESVLDTEGVFVEIGYDPNSTAFQSIVDQNDRGEIRVDAYNRTNVEGIFAAGDVTDIPYKQIILSAAEGAKSALAANEYLNSQTEA